MKRMIYAAVLAGLMFLGGEKKAKAQFATFDFSNLTQAILSFIQDGDNIALNTSQFLQNLGVMEEQLEFLREMNQRYKEVRADIYKIQDVTRIAQNYEMTIRMFTMYVDRIKSLDGREVEYFEVRNMVNQGFQFLLIASREVKKARDYLSSESELSEDERRRGLANCDNQVSKANVAMYNYINDTYKEIDMGRKTAQMIQSMDEAFKINWDSL